MLRSSMRLRSSFSCRPPGTLICPALVMARGARRKSAMVSTHSTLARFASSRSSHGASGPSLTSSFAARAVLLAAGSSGRPCLFRCSASAVSGDAVVHHPPAEMVAVDPVGHRGIVLEWDQVPRARSRRACERKKKENALGRAFPDPPSSCRTAI